MAKYQLRCPNCGEYITLRMEDLDASREHDVVMNCPYCKAELVLKWNDERRFYYLEEA